MGPQKMPSTGGWSKKELGTPRSPWTNPPAGVQLLFDPKRVRWSPRGLVSQGFK